VYNIEYLQNRSFQSMKKTYSSWSKDELRTILGLTKTQQCLSLDKWIAAAEQQTITEFEERTLEHLYQKGRDRIDVWQEAELRDQFISVITSLVDFYSYQHFFNAFSERTLSATIQELELTGKVDWMVATGEEIPQNPFFFIHEYKKEEANTNTNASGRAQLYAMMRAAQELNKDQESTIYGCYVLGRFWFFTTLVNNQYCITNAYNATTREGLLTITKILKAQKELIIQRLSTKQ